MTRCPGCMAENAAEFPCPHCGWNDAQQGGAHLLRPGTVLKERYYIGRSVGQGGFGITYLGWDNVLSVKAAIKEYFPMGLVTRNPDTMQVGYAGDEARGEFEHGLVKFMEEARTLASFTHSPGIVFTRDFFREGALAYMVMEYLEGMDLKHYLARQGGRISWENAQSVVMHVIDALKDVHAEGLLHRDISPDNIFVTNRGQIKILDFGSARFAAGMQNKSLSVVLKPGYAPVEQYQTRGHQGPWTDVYSLGATLYRCVAGSLPPESLSRLEQDGLRTPSSLGLSVPQTFERALMKALAVKAKDRFQSVQDFQAALLGQPLSGRSAAPEPAASDFTASGSAASAGPAQTPGATAVFRPAPPPAGAQRRKPLLKPLSIGAPLCAVFAAALYMLLSADTPGEPLKPTPQRAEQPRAEQPRPAIPRPEEKAAEENPQELFETAEKLIRSARARDVREAVELYERAAGLGYTEAMVKLGNLHEVGNAVRKNLRRAAAWYQKAIDSGHEEIKLRLAQIYAYGDAGEGFAADFQKAKDLLESLSDKNSGQAKMLLNFVNSRLKN